MEIDVGKKGQRRAGVLMVRDRFSKGCLMGVK